MLQRTHIPEAPWWVVEAVDKKRARLNCIHHLLRQIAYEEVKHPHVALPSGAHHSEYQRTPVPVRTRRLLKAEPPDDAMVTQTL